ncbi:putative GTP pyrophosphokinase [Paenibacillus sp. PastF-3]|uniref:GTP pyrophosphokinase n=1 Tax=Paenibacillus sp. PastF-3 TaxID=2940626 RepID=UPI002472F7DB|nr:RelA/SpoT domain-containing protein [Paenibacillus sp. PastF-3]MDH6370567.1 putative GTP pyrophosphokinase [Paenibacillus sp. PastF-3]
MSSIQNKSVEDLRGWYTENRQIYSNLANKVEAIIKELLDSEGVTYYSISSRGKDLDSFVKKAQKDKYNDPKHQIQDLAGIRIITYVRSEVIKACEIIKPLFKIDEKNSIDKSSELGKDKVGYRSVHYVATLTDERLALPEYKGFKDLHFEIQIRTLLEHAWADITHDRSYKFTGQFPPEYDIERRFSLASATLELVDREFDAIVNTLDAYEKETEGKAKNGEYDSPINATSLENYLLHKLDFYIESEIIDPTFNRSESLIVEELLNFGIYDLKQLDNIVSNVSRNYPLLIAVATNYMGLLRYVMIYTDIDLYFNNAWNSNWTLIAEDFVKLSRKYGIDLDFYLETCGINVDDEDDEDDE